MIAWAGTLHVVLILCFLLFSFCHGSLHFIPFCNCLCLICLIPSGPSTSFSSCTAPHMHNLTWEETTCCSSLILAGMKQKLYRYKPYCTEWNPFPLWPHLCWLFPNSSYVLANFHLYHKGLRNLMTLRHSMCCSSGNRNTFRRVCTSFSLTGFPVETSWVVFSKTVSQVLTIKKLNNT